MRVLPLLCGTLLLALAYWPEARAQNVDGEPEGECPLLEQVRALKLDSLQRGRTTVHFMSGYSERAERLASRVDRALEFYSDSLGAELDEFHLIMPDKTHWGVSQDVTSRC